MSVPSIIKKTPVVENHETIINLLIKHGAKINAKNELGNTALHTVCLLGDVTAPAGSLRLGGYRHQIACRALPIITAFLHAGANPNSLNKLGQTPAHLLMRTFTNAVQEVDEEYFNINKLAEIIEEQNVEELFSTVCSVVGVLAEADADFNRRRVKGLTPLHELMHGLNQCYQKKYDDGEVFNQFAQYADMIIYVEDLLSPPRNELAPIIAELVKGGARSWEVVPEPCSGLEKALIAVWKKGDMLELRCLFEKLEPDLKVRIKAGLRVLNRHLQGRTELHMRILAEALPN
jgi:hypothetical protein